MIELTLLEIASWTAAFAIFGGFVWGAAYAVYHGASVVAQFHLIAY